MQRLQERLIAHRAYINLHGEDMPEIRDWRWSGRPDQIPG
jgi:xylulose-5-phosphate/fructose-6-phosphate phosphoketolase